MGEKYSQPKWFKEISSFKGVISTFIIEGNIYDIYPYLADGSNIYDFLTLNQILEELFRPANGGVPYEFLYYNLSTGFFDPTNTKNVNDNKDTSNRLKKRRSLLESFKEELRGLNEIGTEVNEQTIKDSEVIRTTLTVPPIRENADIPTAVVIDYASRFVSSPDNLSEPEIQFFLNLQVASNNAKAASDGRKNTLILIVDKFSDVPAWFYTNNPNIRRVTVPNPDRETRKVAIEEYYNDYFCGERLAQKEKFIDLTDSMKISEIASLSKLLSDNGNTGDSTITDVSDLISIYKYGFKDNKWKQIRDKLRGRDLIGELKENIKGQDQAIEKAVSIIKRAVTGVSGLQHSSATKPKGILFLAGTTGTGKTELVKTITKLLFEDERSLVRFDMSEYSEENSDQKLFGAPPGYVGYGHGGQLTNAIRANPFSVLLFDEIEKAHPTIMDKFLQILEDGRMTDGQGNTVYFSETMIFFTSNKGTYKDIFDDSGHLVSREPIIKMTDTYEDIHDKVITELKRYFKPEVYGRIGESNIVVFNIITPEVAKEIADKMLKRINENIEKEYSVKIEIGENAMNWLYTQFKNDKYMQSGGRGIGNAIEELYLNNLGAFLFDTAVQENSIVHVGLKKENDGLEFSV